MGVRNKIFILYFKKRLITFGTDKSFSISILAKGEEISRLGPQDRKKIKKKNFKK